MAENLERKGCLSSQATVPSEVEGKKVLQPDDVSVPFGRRPARRQHVRFYRRRRLRPVSGDAGLRRV